MIRDVEINDPRWMQLVYCECGLIRTARTQRFDLAFGFEPPLSETNWRDIRVFGQQQEAVQAVRKFIEKPEGWLYLTGPYGDGKTTLAALAVNMLRQKKIEAVFAGVATLLQYLRDAMFERGGEIPESDLDYIKRVPVLVLDDLGAERLTDWAAEQMHELLNWRYVKRRPTIITSNYTPSELLDGRMASRISDISLTQIIDCGDGDVRSMQR